MVREENLDRKTLDPRCHLARSDDMVERASLDVRGASERGGGGGCIQVEEVHYGLGRGKTSPKARWRALKSPK